MTLRKLLFILFFGWLILAPVPEKALQSTSISVHTALTARGGGQENSESFSSMSTSNKISTQVPRKTNNLAKKKFFREMLKKHFPDSTERINYQMKQAKFYRSALSKISETKRVGMSNSLKLTSQEQDALDYSKGKNFYSYYQNVKTSTNIYDTRKSFLLKMENEEMRDKFLKNYNRKRIQLPTETNH